MQEFNAAKARQLTVTSNLDKVIKNIKTAAEKGYSTLDIANPLHQGTVNELLRRGFMVDKHPAIIQIAQKLFYTISW